MNALKLPLINFKLTFFVYDFKQFVKEKSRTIRFHKHFAEI